MEFDEALVNVEALSLFEILSPWSMVEKGKGCTS